MNLEGTVLYNILPNGDLNGLYTNNILLRQNLVLWERATRLDDQTYNCVYQDNEEGEINCTLHLQINGNVVRAEWILEGKPEPTFRGEGFRMDNHIALRYWVV